MPSVHEEDTRHQIRDSLPLCVHMTRLFSCMPWFCCILLCEWTQMYRQALQISITSLYKFLCLLHLFNSFSWDCLPHKSGWTWITSMNIVLKNIMLKRCMLFHGTIFLAANQRNECANLQDCHLFRFQFVQLTKDQNNVVNWVYLDHQYHSSYYLYLKEIKLIWSAFHQCSASKLYTRTCSSVVSHS